MKKQIIQIVSAFILFIIALCVKFENIWITRAIYLIGYLIVGGEIILKAIKKLNVFGQVNKYGLNKEIIKKSLIDLKPREDRYSIVNRYENKLNERYKILKKLYNIIDGEIEL